MKNIILGVSLMLNIFLLLGYKATVDNAKREIKKYKVDLENLKINLNVDIDKLATDMVNQIKNSKIIR